MRDVKPEQTKGPAGGNRQIPASDLGMDAENSRFFIDSFFMSSEIFYVAAGIGGLDLDLTETVLPDGGVGGNTVLAEVNEDVPGKESASCEIRVGIHGDVHGIAVHGLAHQDIVVVVVGGDLLESDGSALLELIDGLGGGTGLLKLLENLLNVA